MQSRFEFLEGHFPKLAAFGKKAEESMNSDANICLLKLGRIAETVTDLLARNNNLESSDPQELLELDIIDENIYKKISALTEISEEALENSYASKMACARLMTTAQELSEWFVLKHGESKFSFLSDLFPPGSYVPPLLNLAELGREAEDNLFINTRYCIICLGDIGEAVVDFLMTANTIQTHERDQLYRIDRLFDKNVIDEEMKNQLHELRIARNKAVHQRYDNNYISEEEGKRLLNDVLNICEWLFKVVMCPGYIVKGYLTEKKDDCVTIAIGNMAAQVPLNEFELNEDGAISEKYSKTQKYIFKVIENENNKIILSFHDASREYQSNVTQQYKKYKIGQDVKVIIQSVSNLGGAIVKLKDSDLEAKIPASEIGRRLYNYDNENKKQILYEVKARVKFFSLTEYPPLILSLKDIEDEEREARRNKINLTGWGQNEKSSRSATQNLKFLALCKSGTLDKIIAALDSGADPNSKNNSNNRTTALMTAARYNKDPKVIAALINAGAEINARNHNGNTALMFAAMENTPEVIKMLCSKGADIEALNHDKKSALHYAKLSKILNKTDVIKLLTPNSTAKPQEKTTEKTPDEKLLELCKFGNAQEISEIIQAGADVNFSTSSNTTPLMIAAEYNTVDSIIALIKNKAEVNAFNRNGNTALMLASQFNTLESVQALIENGADINTKNKAGNTALIYATMGNNAELIKFLCSKGALVSAANDDGKKALDYAKKNNALNKPEIISLLTPQEKSQEDSLMATKTKKTFLTICKSGSEKEISDAISKGVNVNSKNIELSTALMFAAKSNTSGAVKILLDAGAYIDAQDTYGHTALMYAMAFNSEEVVQVLLDAGADTELQDISGYKARDYLRS
ncbi:MAG: ankyrin repeat domain-containing protein [Synergistaceae bacterium]|nr:ankyrin repeat domain-containing protein [Synergistaceae bacterium]